MRLCAIKDADNNHLFEKLAANRIEKTCGEIEKKPLAYNYEEIACALQSLVLDGEGILRATELYNETKDVNGEIIDVKTVYEELYTLSATLQKVNDVIDKTFATQEGKQLWQSKEIVIINNGAFSFTLCCAKIKTISEKMKYRADSKRIVNTYVPIAKEIKEICDSIETNSFGYNYEDLVYNLDNLSKQSEKFVGMASRKDLDLQFYGGRTLRRELGTLSDGLEKTIRVMKKNLETRLADQRWSNRPVILINFEPFSFESCWEKMSISSEKMKALAADYARITV